MKLAIYTVIILLLFGCTVAGLTEKEQSARSALRKAEEDNIREVVFRFQFGQWPGKACYFLSLGAMGADLREEELYHESPFPDMALATPTEEFMKRFGDLDIHVAKLPPLTYEPCMSVKTRIMRRWKSVEVLAIILRVFSIEWVSEMEVRVRGGYYECGDSASGNTYRVVKKDGKWVVKEDKLDWIS